MIVLNDVVIETPDFSEDIFQKGFSIYEVIRIFKGKPIFLKDNLLRLENSLKKSNLRIDIKNLKVPDKLNRYIELEQIKEGNLKYVLHFTDGKTDEYIYRIPHSYPNSKNYEEGVDTVTFSAIRKNPEVKYINPELRIQTNRLIEEKKVYEVLLVDPEGYITEGSRSNVFFIQNETLYTASTRYVLPGTSRKRVFDICKKLEIPVIEERIALKNLKAYEAAFITGTSPLILPIRKVDKIYFNPQHSLLKRLMQEYFSLLESVF